MVSLKLYDVNNINDPGRETVKTSAMISQTFKMLRVSNKFATEERASLAIFFLIVNISLPENHPEKNVLTSLSHSLWKSILTCHFINQYLIYHSISSDQYTVSLYSGSLLLLRQRLAQFSLKIDDNKKIKFRIISSVLFYEFTFLI